MKECACQSYQTETIHEVDFILEKQNCIRTDLQGTKPTLSCIPSKINDLILLNKPARCKNFYDHGIRINESWNDCSIKNCYFFLMLLFKKQLFSLIKSFFILLLLCPSLVQSDQLFYNGTTEKSFTTSSENYYLSSYSSNITQNYYISSRNHETNKSFCEMYLKIGLNYSPENKNITRFMECSSLARQDFENFLNLINKYVYRVEYVISKSEAQMDECIKNYKKWICLFRCGGFFNIDSVSVCENVEKLCPVFRIFTETKIRGGQPVYMCTGFGGFKWNPKPTADNITTKLISNSAVSINHSRVHLIYMVIGFIITNLPFFR